MRTLLVALLVSVPLLAGADDNFLIRGATVHPVSGPEMKDGSVLVRDGKIVGIGHNLSSPRGTRVIEGKGLHVYPGMINSATELGLAEINSIRESVDTGEIGDFNPQLRAEVAVNPSSEHIPVTRANGITTAIVLPMGAGRGEGPPRSGNTRESMITGQAALVHLDGWTWEEMDVKKSAGMAMRFPIVPSPPRRFGDGPPNLARYSYADSKKAYEAQVRDLRQFFEQSRRYQKAKAAKPAGFKIDLKYEAMLPVLENKTPLVVLANRERAIGDAIKFADEQKVKLVIANPKELGKAGAEMKARGVPAILGPTLALPEQDDDPYDAAYSLPNEFYKAGVKFAFGSFDNEFARNVPYQAATAAAFGLPREEALKSVTINAAQIWGMGDKIGSIEEGKWADLVITDGDPLEAKTQIKQLFIKGKNVDLDSKHKRLYEKYLNRP